MKPSLWLELPTQWGPRLDKKGLRAWPTASLKRQSFNFMWREASPRRDYLRRPSKLSSSSLSWGWKEILKLCCYNILASRSSFQRFAKLKLPFKLVFRDKLRVKHKPDYPTFSLDASVCDQFDDVVFESKAGETASDLVVLPAIFVREKRLHLTGLCSVLRFILKYNMVTTAKTMAPEGVHHHLLGYQGECGWSIHGVEKKKRRKCTLRKHPKWAFKLKKCLCWVNEWLSSLQEDVLVPQQKYQNGLAFVKLTCSTWQFHSLERLKSANIRKWHKYAWMGLVWFPRNSELVVNYVGCTFCLVQNISQPLGWCISFRNDLIEHQSCWAQHHGCNCIPYLTECFRDSGPREKALPKEFEDLEAHLGKPIKIHNIRKRMQKDVKQARLSSCICNLKKCWPWLFCNELREEKGETRGIADTNLSLSHKTLGWLWGPGGLQVN